MEELSELITERRRKTRNKIYQYLYTVGDGCTKQAIAADLKLSMPTVYQNLTELMEAGLVRYAGERQSTGGRRAQGLAIVEDARFAVGISVMEDRVRFAAADLRLHELAYKKVPQVSVMRKENPGSFLAQELELFLNENRMDRKRLLGVGIALPAVIDRESKNIVLSPTLQLRDINLQNLTRYLPYPCHVENDATSGGYAEWFARTGGEHNMAYLSLESGVGGAVLVNGDQYAGDNRRSGEFGHMCVEPGGLLCKCGKRGCLEAYCSTRRISEDLGITLEDFFASVEAHAPAYEALWDDVLQHLAIGVNNVRMALDCDVVLGGFLTQYMEPYLPRLREYLSARNTFEYSSDYLHLCKYPKRAVVLGVALPYIKQFLEYI